MLEVVKAAPADITGLRQAYLAALPEPQELHCEIQVRRGQAHFLMRSSVRIGYAVVGKDNTLLEYHTVDGANAEPNTVFARVVTTLGIRRALCKSFDHLFLKACLGKDGIQAAYGLLFREAVDCDFTAASGLVARRANGDDLATVLAIHDGFFGTETQAAAHIKNDLVFLYVADANPIGCGLLTQVIADRADYDIGMVVAPDHRRRGYGTSIVRHLKHLCLTSGWRPIAGCHVNNVGSRKSLEAAGFLSRHELLEFRWP
jgi:GNAT superfamily N-acetyltransferase